VRLRIDGQWVDRLGTFIVKLDGRRYRVSTVKKLTLKLRVTRQLAPGKHRVRVFFRRRPDGLRAVEVGQGEDPGPSLTPPRRVCASTLSLRESR